MKVEGFEVPVSTELAVLKRMQLEVFRASDLELIVGAVENDRTGSYCVRVADRLIGRMKKAGRITTSLRPFWTWTGDKDISALLDLSAFVWDLVYVAGNPAIFSAHTSNASNPLPRETALAGASKIAMNGWRVWVVHTTSGERIFESEAEKAHNRARSA